MSDDIYTNDTYRQQNPTWHAEDSPWKAEQIRKILSENHVPAKRIAEVGCGAGRILEELASSMPDPDLVFAGYELSPQAYEMALTREKERLTFHLEDPLDETRRFDVLLVIDVFEHVPDYMGFVARCGAAAEYKVYHIPLSLHVSSVVRNRFIKERYTLGHIHYFTAESALATVRDAGQEIIDYRFTAGAMGLFGQHPSIKRLVANVPRWLISRFSVPMAARFLGGYSLLVLSK